MSMIALHGGWTGSIKPQDLPLGSLSATRKQPNPCAYIAITRVISRKAMNGATIVLHALSGRRLMTILRSTSEAEDDAYYGCKSLERGDGYRSQKLLHNECLRQSRFVFLFIAMVASTKARRLFAPQEGQFGSH